MIKPESVELLKTKIDIVDVVGSYIELKRSGANFVGVCPFHDEKTASFSVNPARQFYHCFGCKAGGDAIKFVQDIEKISFTDAVEKLANEHNIALEYTAVDRPKKVSTKPLDLLNSLFIKNLPLEKTAYGYLMDRGVSEATIREFELGYAGDSRSQEQALRAAKIPMPSALEVGAFVQDEGGREYARFTNRITFPIKNSYGVLVGFGGRTITNHPAKYINSPQSAVFNKSRLLYGLDIAKDHIVKSQKVIVVEGYMDAIMLHQAGFKNTVATLGTALTDEHIPLLKRLDPKEIILSYDSDSAGQAAALKASRLLASKGFRGGVALLEQGKDPADLIRSNRLDLINRIYANPKPFLEFTIDHIVQNSDKNRDEIFIQMREFLKTLGELTAEDASRYAAVRLGIDPRRFRQKRSGAVVQRQHFDLAELSVLKTIATDATIHEALFDYLDIRLFEHHADLYEVVSNSDHPLVRQTVMDEQILTLEVEEARDKIRLFIAKYYEKELIRVKNDSDISFSEKSYKLRKIQDAIKRLRGGELVAII